MDMDDPSEADCDFCYDSDGDMEQEILSSSSLLLNLGCIWLEVDLFTDYLSTIFSAAALFL